MILSEAVGLAADCLVAVVRAEVVCGNVSTGDKLDAVADSKLRTDIISARQRPLQLTLVSSW